MCNRYNVEFVFVVAILSLIVRDMNDNYWSELSFKVQDRTDMNEDPRSGMRMKMRRAYLFLGN